MIRRMVTLAASTLFSTAAVIALLFLLNVNNRSVFDSVFAAHLQNPPTVAEVDPDSAPNDLATPIVITGTGFDTTLSVYLGDTALEDVIRVSASRLEATVPWGMEPGIYTLIVENPDAQSGSLPDAFTVTQGIGVWRTGGPYGGRVQEIYLNPTTSTTVYALVYAVGIFASFDDAEHWEPMLKVNNPTRLVFDAQDPDIMYCGGSGLQQDNLRSMDGGQTWEVFFDEFHPQNGAYMSYPAPHPTQAGVIYLATGGVEDIDLLPGEGGVYYSEDYGQTWVTRTSGLTDTHLVDIAFHPSDPATMFAASSSGNVFTTTNGGLTWHWAADLDHQLRRIYFDPSGTPAAWILPHVDEQPPAAPFLYKSSDLSLSTWISTVVTDAVVSGGGIYSLAFLTDTVWAAGDRGYNSNDSGTTWTPVVKGDNPFPNEIQTFAFLPGDDQTIYVGTELDGFVRSLDGGSSWQEKNQGLAGLQLRGLAVPRGQIDTIYANTFERGILRSDDGGQTWLELVFFHGGTPKGQVLAADPFAPERVYFGDYCNDIPCMRYSANWGVTWQEVTMTMPSPYTGWIGKVFVTAPHPGESGRILAGIGFCLDWTHCKSGNEPSGIYSSDDHGESWSYLGPTPVISEVLSIAYDSGDPDLIYAGTRGMGLWRSSDSGDTWMAVPIPGVLPPIEIADIATHPDIPSTVYVRLYSYADSPNPQPNLFVSANAGATWQELPDVDTVFGGIGGHGLVFVPPVPAAGFYTLFSGCEVGLCRSPDGGNTWEQVEDAPRPSSNGFTTALVSNSDGQRSRLYIGTPGGVVSPIEPSLHEIGWKAADTIPGLGNVLGGGVYRMTTRLQKHWLYLPLSPKR